MEQIYLDNAATTPLHPQVRNAMMPYLEHFYGNPSSIHRWGRQARLALDDARLILSKAIHAHPSQIVFTSGGTEADNMAIIGAAMANRERGNHIITTQVEHHAVLHTCEFLEKVGYCVTYLPVDHTGKVSVDDYIKAIRPETIVATIMYGNNEVGTIQPIEEIGHISREKGIIFHSDTVQALGIVEINASMLPVDLMSFSAHKIQGPKGVGGLYISKNVLLKPQMFGGAQERNRRAGTENVAGIVGFAEAVKHATANIESKRNHLMKLRRQLVDVLNELLGAENFVFNGNTDHFLPHILNVSFPGTDTEALLMNLDLLGIAVASGSACTSGSLEISHVLEAMGLDDSITRSAVRYSFSSETSEDEVVMAAKKTAEIVTRIRSKNMRNSLS